MTVDFEAHLDLNATIKALNTVLLEEELTEEDKLILKDLNEILIETLQAMTATKQ